MRRVSYPWPINYGTDRDGQFQFRAQNLGNELVLLPYRLAVLITSNILCNVAGFIFRVFLDMNSALNVVSFQP